MSFNKVILVGNLGRDPETRNLPDGTPVTTFPLATNERSKKNGEAADLTTWFRVSLFGRQAEVAAEHLAKGRPVYIEGRLRQDEYTDRDGKQRTTLDVRATDMQFIGTKPEGGEAQAPKAMSASVGGNSGSRQSVQYGGGNSTANREDDIPF